LLNTFKAKINTIRFKLEQAFGTMKRRLHLARARYFGSANVQAQMCLAALGMNLLNAYNKLKRMEFVATGAPGTKAKQGSMAPKAQRRISNNVKPDFKPPQPLVTPFSCGLCRALK
jgi:IS5 family transposase